MGMWWFGQNGFIFKSPEGTLASVDLYLTDSCADLVPGLDTKRQIPILLRPEDVEVDVFACTHNHQDHTDPETVRNLVHKDTMRFAGPHPSCDVFAREGVESGRIVPTWPDCYVEHRDLKLHGTFAMPTDTSDLNHMGFVVQFGDGPKVYITGDTDYTDLLLGVTKHAPDIVITCINGGFNNLSHWEAADMVGKIKPKIAIPCHYDMFADNSVNPQQFRASLQLRAEDVKYHQLKHGEPFLFEKP
jgi:L-ascorbate 6-phosphate lactonase